MEIPGYPFFNVEKPEAVFGAQQSRYLDVSKDAARAICAALPEETAMADMLFGVGHLGEDQFGMSGREFAVDATPEEVRDTTSALLRSFAPSHEIKIATMAVALHRWFPLATKDPSHD